MCSVYEERIWYIYTVRQKQDMGAATRTHALRSPSFVFSGPLMQPSKMQLVCGWCNCTTLSAHPFLFVAQEECVVQYKRSADPPPDVPGSQGPPFLVELWCFQLGFIPRYVPRRRRPTFFLVSEWKRFHTFFSCTCMSHARACYTQSGKLLHDPVLRGWGRRVVAG